MLYTALEVAKWFTKRNEDTLLAGGERMSKNKLCKLLYYAEGCSLALTGESLFLDEITAWDYGPIVQSVFSYYSDPYIAKYCLGIDYASAQKVGANKEVADLLEQVFCTFGPYSAWGLSQMSMRETPWLEATNGGKILDREISRETMRQCFSERYIVQGQLRLPAWGK